MKYFSSLKITGRAGKLQERTWKIGIEVVALFTTTSFSKNEKSRTLVSKDEASINLQGMFDQYGKRWANWQIQWKGKQTSPTTFGTVFLQAEKNNPHSLSSRCMCCKYAAMCSKFGLKLPPKQEYLKTHSTLKKSS
jgi:hypothetical protein